MALFGPLNPLNPLSVLYHTLLKPILKPLFRIILGLFAQPLLYIILKIVAPRKQIDAKLKHDLECWLRCSLVLLAATANFEALVFHWIPWHIEKNLITTLLLRLMLAVSVIESMPDQEIFNIIHRAPPKLKIRKNPILMLKELWERRIEFLKGLGYLHLRRSSPVMVIMCVIIGGQPGEHHHLVCWICYFIAAGQYLLISMLTTKEGIRNVLNAFDEEMKTFREDIIEEFEIKAHPESDPANQVEVKPPKPKS